MRLSCLSDSIPAMVRTVVLGGAVLALGACNDLTTQWAQSNVEAQQQAEAAQYEAQGNPRFSDPAKAAIVQRFETEFAEYGRDAEAVAAGAQGEECRVDDPAAAFELIHGESSRSRQEMMSMYDVTYVPDLDSIRITMVSGNCAVLGSDGAAEFVARMRAVQRFGEGEYSVIELHDSVYRVSGSWTGGERDGPFRTIEVVLSTQMTRNESGEFEVTKHDWDHLNRMNEAPTAIYTYETFGPDAAASPKLTFRRQPETLQFTTIAEDPRPDGTVAARSYNATDLRIEYGMKDGLLHGWYRMHAYDTGGYTVPARTICYQNGKEVKSTTCPAT